MQPTKVTQKSKNVAGSQDRLYQELARTLSGELASGNYKIGDRLPAERELASEYGVSRPTVREAVIALEVQGLVEVRVGSGAYVKRIPGKDDRPGFNVTAFELTEARLLVEGEAAALAATQISDAELAKLEQLIKDIATENRLVGGQEDADRAFHLAIARATRNTAIYNAIEELWRLRTTSPESALLHEKARTANVKPVVDEHTAIFEALREHNPTKARIAMRTHLSAVIESLLFATEEAAIAEARKLANVKRARFAQVTA
jgi:GntR family transcriptional repressor for pyruvate dehydrogenase complex